MAFSAPNQDIERMRPPEGTALSFNADEAITRGQVVKIGSDNGVEPSDTDGEDTVGVSAQTVSSGDDVMVIGPGGRALFTAGSGTISAGDYLTSHGATGEEGQVDTAGTTGDSIIGVAHEGSSAQGDTLVGHVVNGGQIN